MSAASEAHWYAVHTHAGAEMKALAHLKRQNYQVYLPLLHRKVRHARKIEQVLRPFFPRYLFVSLDLRTHGWRSIRSTGGVTDVVCFGDQPAPLPRGVVEGLKSHEDSNGCISFARKSCVTAGDTVVVLDGPFSRLAGLCEAVSESERVTVLLDLLGRRVRVSLEADAVEVA
jgi:transcriptional antiterminator RfaH